MRILKKIAIALVIVLVLLAIAGWWIARGDPAEYTLDQVTGTDPLLAEPDPQTIPTVGVARPIGWPDGAAPEAAQGLAVNRFAEKLEHPRTIYAMPNGDILVAESNAPDADPRRWQRGHQHDRRVPVQPRRCRRALAEQDRAAARC